MYRSRISVVDGMDSVSARVLRAEVGRLAVLPVSGTVPSVLPPDLNVTVPLAMPPVGTPPSFTVTAAVNVTTCPAMEGIQAGAECKRLVATSYRAPTFGVMQRKSRPSIKRLR